MCVSLPTSDLPKIQDDSRLRPIELQSIVFVACRLPLLCFCRNPRSWISTEARSRISGFPPARAHVMAGCLDAEVGSVLLVALVVEDELGLDVERLRNWPAKPSLSAVKVPMLAMMISFRLNKVRAHRVLVVIRPAGDGLAAPLAVATQWRAGRRKEFGPRGMRAAQGKLFSLQGCGHQAQGAAAPPPGFTTRQGRTGRPLPNGDVANSASPRDGCTGLRPDAGQVNAPTTRPERPCRSSRPHTEAWCGSSIEARLGGVSVNRLS